MKLEFDTEDKVLFKSQFKLDWTGTELGNMQPGTENAAEEYIVQVFVPRGEGLIKPGDLVKMGKKT